MTRRTAWQHWKRGIGKLLDFSGRKAIVDEWRSEELLHRIWNVEQEILDEIHRVCTENGIRYSLTYGTLLGAVRHKGFIPWDDDVDVMMPREDYDRFVSAWDTSAHPGFLLQTEQCSDDYNNNFGKVRKDKTTFLQYEAQGKRKFHKGIYVDIFPLDRKAPSGIQSKIQYLYFALNLLLNRGYASGAKGFVGFTEKILLGLIPKRSYRTVSLWFGKRSRKWNSNKALSFVSASTIVDTKKQYSSNLFDNLKLISFQGKQYYSIEDTNAFLRTCYGDYMTPPPIEERTWKHHPVLIDFEHNYDEL